MFENKSIVIALVVIASVIGAVIWQKFEENGVQVLSTEKINVAEDGFTKTDDAMPVIDIQNSDETSYSKNNQTIVQANDHENSEAYSHQEPTNQYVNGGVDEIGGYIDESAIAPEDEVPQNNFIDSIGYDDPTAEDPAAESTNTNVGDDMMETKNSVESSTEMDN